ncbi:hypothetical protein F5888DRAFT_1803951 [Russula emetica]|nr:hypothetical protein F5888DRAFT_1803951 [Russula emetica]
MASSPSGVQVPLSGGTPTSAVSPTLSVLSPQDQLHQSIGSEVLLESDREDDCARLGQPLPDGSLEAHKREDSVGLLSPPLSQLSPRASLLGSRNGSSTFLTWISGAFRFRSRLLGCVHTHCLIQGFGGTSRSSIELVLGHMPQPSYPPATGAVHLGIMSDVDGSEGAPSNPESHTFGLSVVGGVGSLLP